MSERLQKQVSVCCEESDYSGWPTSNAIALIEWLSEKVAEVPEEYRGSAEIDISSSSGYDGESSSTIHIFYYRPETDAEMSARIEQEERDRRREKEREIRLLNSLKAKYEQ